MRAIEKEVGIDAVNDWLGHPVTEWLAVVIADRAEIALENRSNTFVPSNPYATQELLSRYNGAIDELNAIYQSLTEVPDDSDDEHPLNWLAPEWGDEDE